MINSSLVLCRIVLMIEISSCEEEVTNFQVINLQVTHVTGGKGGYLLNFIQYAQCLQPKPQNFLSKSKKTP